MKELRISICQQPWDWRRPFRWRWWQVRSVFETDHAMVYGNCDFPTMERADEWAMTQIKTARLLGAKVVVL